MCESVHRGQKEASDPPELELQVTASCPAWMLEPNTGLLRAMLALNH